MFVSLTLYNHITSSDYSSLKICKVKVVLTEVAIEEVSSEEDAIAEIVVKGVHIEFFFLSVCFSIMRQVSVESVVDGWNKFQ